jgi:hypothetical protein
MGETAASTGSGEGELTHRVSMSEMKHYQGR